MRLKERTLMQAALHPRLKHAGTLGGLKEAFSPEGTILRASVLPGEGGLACEERGLVNRDRLRLLIARDVQAQVGDGVMLEGRMYRILAARRWWAHLELECEAIP